MNSTAYIRVLGERLGLTGMQKTAGFWNAFRNIQNVKNTRGFGFKGLGAYKPVKPVTWFQSMRHKMNRGARDVMHNVMGRFIFGKDVVNDPQKLARAMANVYGHGANKASLHELMATGKSMLHGGQIIAGFGRGAKKALKYGLPATAATGLAAWYGNRMYNEDLNRG